MQRLSFNTTRNENCCDVCVASHISTCRHFIIPRGATNSRPSHAVTLALVEKPSFALVSFTPAVANPAEQLWRSVQAVSRPDRSAGMLVLWWMQRGQIIIHIPQSLPLHTHSTSCYLVTAWTRMCVSKMPILQIIKVYILNALSGLSHFLWLAVSFNDTSAGLGYTHP